VSEAQTSFVAAFEKHEQLALELRLAKCFARDEGLPLGALQTSAWKNSSFRRCQRG
jgi:hypothetical protein